MSSTSYKIGDFFKFAGRYRSATGERVTHTSIDKPKGRFNVPDEKLDEFFEMYCKALSIGESLHFTEKHGALTPVKVDIDFRFVPPIKRHYTQETIERVVKAYTACIREYLVMDDDCPAFVMEKCEPKDVKGKIKDGMHIIFPSAVTKPGFQFFLRDKMLKKAAEMFNGLPLTNAYNDVIDHAVINTNPWQMYGSGKPDCEAYRVTQIWCNGILKAQRPTGATEATEATGATEATKATKATTKKDKKEESDDDNEESDDESDEESDDEEDDKNKSGDTRTVAFPSEAELVRLLSMRNKGIVTTLQASRAKEVDEFERNIMPTLEKKQRDALHSMIFGDRENKRKNMIQDDDELEFVKMLVTKCLAPERAETYDAWIRIGWCLRNIDHRLMETWIAFSRLSTKFMEGECEERWKRMNNNENLGMGSLRFWAKNDNPQVYRDLLDNQLFPLIDKAANSKGAHFDVACVIQRMYKDKYVFVGRDTWYVFDEFKHRWIKSNEGMKLRLLLSREVCMKFHNRAGYWQQRCNEEDNNQMYGDMAKSLHTICANLKNASYKSSCITETKCLFTDDKFDEKLDCQRHLIGFENGVYDLIFHEFRDGQPDDLISFCTGINYIPYNPKSKEAREIQDYLAQVHINHEVRKYMIEVLAMTLDGSTKQERFYIFTGTGSNSKSKCIELFQKSFGDYCCIMPIQVLTQKRAASTAADPALARTRGKRFAISQEPGAEEKINIGILKEITGGDKIIARTLFKEPIEFRPQFKLILTCNDLPQVPSDDNGTWRRIRVVEFKSKFVDKPDPNKPNEFPIDCELNEKFDRWAETFLSYLIEVYKGMDVKKVYEPAEVVVATDKYKLNNDLIGQFISDTLVPVKDKDNHFDKKVRSSPITHMHRDFRAWYNDIGVKAACPNAIQLRQAIEKRYDIEYCQKPGGFIGLKYTPKAGAEESDDD